MAVGLLLPSKAGSKVTRVAASEIVALMVMVLEAGTSSTGFTLEQAAESVSSARAASVMWKNFFIRRSS